MSVIATAQSRGGAGGQGAVTASSRRIGEIDVARTIALLGMAVFHFSRDLEIFGLAPPGTTLTGGWAMFARLVAGSFLFLAGVSLVLAHGEGIRWGAFLRRLGVISAAAALVSVATWAAMPQSFIYFGILHAIAVASLLGVLFLRLPVALTLAVALAVYIAPDVFSSEVFNPRWLAWTGLAEATPRSLDFEPILPWLAPCLLGIAVARLADGLGLWTALRQRRVAYPASLTWPGRHSLAVYLVHQPVLIALVWLASRVITQ